MTRPGITRAEIKAAVQELRAQCVAAGAPITQAAALEIVAHRHGFRDWNAFSAALQDGPPAAWRPGGRVTGRYLGQPFTAKVRRATPAEPGWTRLELALDDAVDVVRSEAFRNLRRRLNLVVGPDGYSRERTSDGAPHLELDLGG